MAEKEGSGKVLVDSFGRRHDYLRLSLTDKCNLRCFYCMPENPCFLQNDHLMSTKELLEITGAMVDELGIRKIRLTGGEPLLRKDVAEIMAGLKEMGVELALTTNGILLDRVFEVMEDVGMKTVNISLDSLKPARFELLTRRDEFQKVWENIEKAIDFGVKVKLNVVVINGVNDDELVDFVALTKAMPVHVRFIEFMPFDGNRWQFEKVFGFKDMLERISQNFDYQKLEDKPHSTSKAFRVPDHLGTFSVISTVTAPFCGDCNRLRLTADGKLRNCLFSRKEWDLLSAHRKGDNFLEIVRSAVAEKYARHAGLPAFSEQEKLKEALSDRAMVAIGG